MWSYHETWLCHLPRAPVTLSLRPTWQVREESAAAAVTADGMVRSYMHAAVAESAAEALAQACDVTDVTDVTVEALAQACDVTDVTDVTVEALAQAAPA